jgi:uracil-DNA glycosylase
MEDNYISDILSGISPSWLNLFSIEKDSGFDIAMDLLKNSRRTVPDRKKIFEAFRHFEPCHTRGIILGQDPYPSGSDGLAFSCKNIKPSLARIFEVLKIQNYIREIPPNGNLTRWADQGLLLLNTSLTIGDFDIWQKFIEEILTKLDSPDRFIVMWGNHAKKFQYLNLKYKTFVWCHPSPICRPRTYGQCSKNPPDNKTLNDIVPETDFLQCDTFNKISEFLGRDAFEW